MRSTLLGTDSFHQMGTILVIMGVALENTIFGLPRTKVTAAQVMALDPHPEIQHTGPQKFDASVRHGNLRTAS